MLVVSKYSKVVEMKKESSASLTILVCSVAMQVARGVDRTKELNCEADARNVRIRAR